MPFSRVRMGKEEIFTTLVEDMDGKTLEKWKVMKQDYPKVVRILAKKFGIKVKVIDQKETKDLDWALK